LLKFGKRRIGEHSGARLYSDYYQMNNCLTGMVRIRVGSLYSGALLSGLLDKASFPTRPYPLRSHHSHMNNFLTEVVRDCVRSLHFGTRWLSL